MHVDLVPDVLILKDVMRGLYGEGIQRGLDDNTIQQIPHSPFSIQLAFNTEPSAREEALIFRLQPGQQNRSKGGVTMANALQALPSIPTTHFQALDYLPPSWISCQLSVAFRMEHTLVGGNYVKLARKLSQTPWELEGDRKTSSSTSEEIANPILEFFRADEYKFHSSGREDVDVRMLGSGRPFVIEFIQPHLNPEVDLEFFERMTQRINSSSSLVQVNNLCLFSNEQFQEMKDSIDQKKKSYRCIVWVSRPLQPGELEPLKQITDLVVNQQTPIRVLHRRSQLNREKIIHTMSAEWINPQFLILDLTTSSGTYVKEFVHSDRGRCHPSLGSILGCEADILQLDVMDLH
jgi:tRNA pseudouridine synthase 10